MNNIDKQKLIDALLSSSGGKLDKNDINGAVSSKNIAPLVSSLSAADRRKLNAALSDKQSMKQALDSPEAKAILNALLGKRK